MLQIGSIILRERQRLSITQETLAIHCQVSKASVSKWEKRQSYPDITLLPKLAAYFDITIDELLSFEHQLSKQTVQELYNDFSQRFGKEPFPQVFQEVENQVKTYYQDPSFILQMSVLMLNHYHLAEDQKSVLSKITQWTERIRQLSNDVWILRQVNTLQANVALMQANPQKTLELLDGVIQPSIGDEVLLATAHEQVGNAEEAMRAIQVMIYQSLLQIVGGSPIYLRLTSSESPLFDETIRRIEGVIELYDLKKLHPNMCIQFYISVAQSAAIEHNRELLYNYLTKYVDVCIRHLWPIELRGDDYFDLLDEWLEQLDLGKTALRNDELIKQSILDFMNAPFFEPYQQDEEMHDLKEKLRWGLEDK
ncbi:helix-turn-helix domain-containing protein [Sporosarcina aquimarina]|uniref:Helix-turn-helix transcriptional regulator n=1 Tax=Sporosarcina aquimarina TaxID=114975 RepID=A0ABU4FVE0_9BACL|nr:helix-turn-helix transcriptional regulator [Sporosarcina aquimarina]MDW0108676.1 helix-turn-helix transcriptional regulator [Sporosarcina aquimarina]